MLKAVHAVLLLSALVSAAAATGPPSPVVQRWIAAAREHRPGLIDKSLLEVADWQASQFETVRRELRTALAKLFDSELARNDVLRRGVLLHTDIAILTPDRAASFTRLPARDPLGSMNRRFRADPPRATEVIVGNDGQFLTAIAVTAHWSFARALADAIRPDPSRDPFVAGWYRATTARFEWTSALGLATPHLQDARRILPRDTWILLYSGALHEWFAAARAQNIVRSGPALSGQIAVVRSPRAELETAVDYFRKTVTGDPSFAEAHLRWGRALGLLGRHAEAADELRRARAMRGEDPEFQYLSELFLASELEALGQRADAQRGFERAAALYPTAQAPLVALSELARRFGDRQGAIDALQRLAALPADPADRDDPWWNYFRSYARNADALMDAVREPFLHEGAR